MKVLNETLIIGINLGDFGSTGGIMRNSLEYAKNNGNYDYLVIVPKSKGLNKTYGYMDYPLNVLQKIIYHRILKQPKRPDGFYETPYTKRIIKRIKFEAKKYRKCFVHLHNIHMASIDLRILFKFLAKTKLVNKVFYTLHDEWAYTGGCYCSTFAKCDKWKRGCTSICPQNCSKHNFSVKKQLSYKSYFTNLMGNKLTLICVSKWLENNVAVSELKNIDRYVNYGETSLNPNHSLKNIKEELGLKNKKIVLSVSSYWNEWKGEKYLYEIARSLPPNYILLVVGGKLSNENCPNILHIADVTQEELADYYKAADVYVSVSQNESLGLTTCEAQLCGTPVVAFGHTAIKETIVDRKTGYIIGEDNNIDKMIRAIIEIVENSPFNKKDIIKNGERFKRFEHAKKMLELYDKFIPNR